VSEPPTLRGALQPWLRRIAFAHAASRSLVGASMLVAPATTARRWLGPAVDSGGGRVALQALGMREVVLGVGVLRSLRSRQAVRHWFALGLLLELVDAVATRRQRPHLPSGREPDAVALFALSGLAGGALLALLLDESG
jgi:hypothetical protein